MQNPGRGLSAPGAGRAAVTVKGERVCEEPVEPALSGRVDIDPPFQNGRAPVLSRLPA